MNDREPMKRINTRIRQSQHMLIKEKAQKENITEGQAIRDVLDLYFNDKPNE